MKKLVFLILLSVPTYLMGQDLRRCVWVKDFDEKIQLDSLTILPGSFSLSSQSIVDFDINSRSISLSPKNTSVDSIKVCYNVLLFNLNDRIGQIHPTSRNKMREENSEIKDQTSGDQENLAKYGAISRTIGYGSRTGSSVLSDMDMIIEGKLNDDLNMRARISDNNVPFQPEGNSQFISEYDNVNLTFFNEKNSIQVGDIRNKSDSSYFLRFKRQVQGVRYDYQREGLSGNLGWAVNKGKFHQSFLSGEEGVQGPYKIRGPENEPYVVIIANSEKVFLDGKLLQRGQDRDYIIDYNLAEITFNHQNIITKYSRIAIQFEYLNRGLIRTSKSAYHSQTIGKLETFAGVYSTKDVIRSDSEQNFQDNLKIYNYEHGITSYIRKDTIINETSFSYYSMSDNPFVSHYRPTFTSVGVGNGDYNKIEGSNDEYFWVGKDEGAYQIQGSSVEPEMHNIINAGGSYKINQFETVGTELVSTSYNHNLLKSDSLKKGFAVKSFIRSDSRKFRFLPGYTINSWADLEYLSSDLKLQDPFREVEFNRDWNNFNKGNSNETVIRTGVELVDGNNESIDINSTMRMAGGQKGSITRINASRKIGRFRIYGNAFNMNRESFRLDYDWERYKAGAEFTGNLFNYNYEFEADHNIISNISSDSIYSSNQFFDSHKYSISSGKNLPFKVKFIYVERRDSSPVENEIVKSDQSRNFNAFLGKKWKSGYIEGQVAYRNLRSYLDDNYETRTLNGGLKGKVTILDGLIVPEFNLENVSGWEPIREFSYVEVQQGRGHYTWKDLNNDGKRQLDEFFEAIHPDEKTYIRLYLHGSGRTPSHRSNIRGRVKLSYPENWKVGSILLKQLSFLSADFKVRNSSTIGESDITERLNAFRGDIENESILSGNQQLNSVFTYSPKEENYTISYESRRRALKSLIFDGNELRNISTNTFRLALYFSDFLTLDIHADREQERNRSTVMQNANMDIETFEWGMSGTTSLKTMRVNLGYIYSMKESIDKAQIHDIFSSVSTSLSRSVRVSTRLSYKRIYYPGEVNTRLAYVIMGGLQPGNNLVWNTDISKIFDSGIELGAFINGRTGSGRRPVHAGQLKVAYRFK